MITRKDILILLSPSLVFAAIIVAALVSSRGMRSDEGAQRESQQKFETFTRKVEAGEWQLTQSEMLNGMRLTRAAAESERKVVSKMADMMGDFAWIAVGGMLLQVIAVWAVKRRAKVVES